MLSQGNFLKMNAQKSEKMLGNNFISILNDTAKHMIYTVYCVTMNTRKGDWMLFTI